MVNPNEKLVRDKIFTDPAPQDVRIRIADPSEMDALLRRKDDEEAREFERALESGDPDAIREEAADCIQTIISRAGLHGISSEEIEEKRLFKLAKSGGFEKGVVLYNPKADTSKRQEE